MAEKLEVATVFIVDDDVALVGSLRSLLIAADFRVEVFTSPKGFVKSWTADRAGCLLLDVRFPGTSGLDLQDELLAGPAGPPVILMTGHADVHMSIRGLKAGAIDFLVKPFDQEMLFQAVRIALDRDRGRRARDAQVDAVSKRLRTLTRRERQVFALVVSGMPNKNIAADLGLSEVTVKVHRSRVMKKMGAASVPDLVRMHAQLETSVADALLASPPRAVAPMRSISSPAFGIEAT